MFRLKLLATITIIIASIFFNNSNANSQGVVVLMQGKVIDKQSGQPVGAAFRFTSETGKKNQSQSSPSDGSYQVVLNSGENYYLSIKQYIVLDPSSYFSIPANTSYKEINQNIYVKKVNPGLELFSFKAFEPNSKTLIKEAHQSFTDVKNFMTMNPNINLKLTISSADSWFKGSTKKIEYVDKKGKAKTKTVKVSPQELLTEFSKARYEEILRHFDELNIPKGHTIFEEDKSNIGQKKKGKSASTNAPNVKIIVYKILDL